MINLDQSKLIIHGANIEQNLTDSTQSDKCKHSGFLCAMAQVISQLNLDNQPSFVHASSSTPNPGCSYCDIYPSCAGKDRFGTSGHFCPCQQPCQQSCLINQLYHDDQCQDIIDTV